MMADLYFVLLQAGFNFMCVVLCRTCRYFSSNFRRSHGSQDLYPTMLENQYEFGPNKVT